jgi:Na+/H+ antiporter NhaC
MSSQQAYSADFGQERSARFASACLLFALLLALGGKAAAQAETLQIELPQVVLKHIAFEVTVTAPDADLQDGAAVTLTVGGRDYQASAIEGSATFSEVLAAESEVTVSAESSGPGGLLSGSAETKAIPGWMAILPALLAIALALTLRQVIPALFLGIWIGGALAYGLSLTGLWKGLLDSVAVYGVEAVSDSGHTSIILFSMMIGGVVGIISRNGGAMGVVNVMVRWASSAKRGQIATWALGVAIFFDDYANTLVVGNTMRPVTDRLQVSREKLAYLVDSTAAPVATLALVTTWIGFEVGLIQDAMSQISHSESAYSVFLNSIAYGFYPLLTILFTLLIATSGRDFGPMLAAERRARSLGQVAAPSAHTGETPAESDEHAPKPGKPQRIINALLPVLVLVFGTLIGIYVTGLSGLEADASLRDIIGNGDSYVAMMWSSLLAVVVAAVLSRVQNILSVAEIADAWFAGARSMVLAMVILTLAWSLANVNEVLHTGDFLVSVLGERLSPALLPALVFVLSAFTAFATGSSWGVMGIMMPLVIPLAWAILEANGVASDASQMHIFYSSVAAVLAGAVFGDHCSPISDTTILSSMASGCDHIDHVRTQLPYALTVGLVGLIAGTVAVGYGLPWWAGLLLGAAVLAAILWTIGRRAED